MNVPWFIFNDFKEQILSINFCCTNETLMAIYVRNFFTEGKCRFDLIWPPLGTKTSTARFVSGNKV